MQGVGIEASPAVSVMEGNEDAASDEVLMAFVFVDKSGTEKGGFGF